MKYIHNSKKERENQTDEKFRFLRSLFHAQIFENFLK